VRQSDTHLSGSGQQEATAQPQTFTLPEQLLWDLPAAAHALNVSERTVKRLAAAGELPGVVHVGSRRLFYRKALEEWIAQGCPPVRRKAGRCGR
jgi:excisionase family DNA binding protein